jgi:large subunit ribosomal protein L19
MNILKQIETKHLETAQAQTSIPNFSPGDTLKVNVRVREGTRERIQAYEGVCIARKGKDISASFTVRKISYGEGVERVFPLYSPRIESIELIRRGSVRRAKLYYLRDLRGKSARIAERTTGHGIDKDAGKKKKGKKTTKEA